MSTPTSADPRDAVARDSDVAAVHAQLRQAILTLELPAGSDMPQARLAQLLDVGRTPLREALRMLQHEGLVVVQPNRRLRITALSAAALEELYATRILLEPAAVRMTVASLTPEASAEMEGLMAQMALHAKSHDFERYEVPHGQFHGALVAGGGGDVSRTQRQLHEHAQRYRRAVAGEGRNRIWKVSTAEHRAILDAVQTGDGPLAAEHLAHHLARAGTAAAAALEPTYQPQLIDRALAAASSAPAARTEPAAL